MNQWLFRYGGDASRRMSVFLFADFGDFFDGDFYNINANLLARLSKHFRSTLGVTRAEIDLPSRPDDPGTPAFDRLPSSEFRFTLAQARLGVTLTTRVTFDALLQYNTAVDDFSSNLRFNYKYRPGSDIYVVYNERRDTEGMPADAADRSFTVKWAYLMAF